MVRLDATVLPEPGRPVVVAVSGGADSSALWDLLARDGRWPLIVWHLDHQLRSESAAEAEAVRRRCDAYAAQGMGPVACVIETAAVADAARINREGIEATARRIRYERLIAVAVAHGAGTVATAHHRGDQAETVILNILRGTGQRGLGGIARSRLLAPGIVVVRPLLDADPANLRAYLRARGLDWCEDASNQDRTFRRNAIRHDLLPAWEALAPGIGAALAARADTHAVAAAAAAAQAEARWQAHAQGSALAASAWVGAQPDERMALWQRLGRALDLAMDRRRLRRIDNLATGGPGRALRLGRWRLVRRAAVIAWEAIRVPAAATSLAAPGPWPAAGLTVEPARAPVSFTASNAGCWLDAAAVRWPLTWRPAITGERWRPLGAPGQQTVAKYRSEHHLSRQSAVLADSTGVLWIPGGTIAERARTRPGQPALRVTSGSHEAGSV